MAKSENLKNLTQEIGGKIGKFDGKIGGKIEKYIGKIGGKINKVKKYCGTIEIIGTFKKGESKVPIFGQGGAIKRPPMDEMTRNFACRGVFWGTFEFWPS